MEFLRVKDIMQKMRISKPQLYKLIRQGMFPNPVKIGKMSVWINTEVEKVMLALCTNTDVESLKNIVREIEGSRHN